MSIYREVIHAPHMMVPLGPEPTLPVVVPEHPNLITKFFRLRMALLRWKKAGLPVTPKPLRKARRAACQNGCRFYDPAKNFGFGECAAPGCGCTGFKAWLLTEECPHPEGSRWPENT